VKQPNRQRDRRARQFAVVTIFAAICLTAAPLCFLLAFQLTDDEPDTDRLLAELGEEVTGPFRSAEETPPLRELLSDSARLDTMQREPASARSSLSESIADADFSADTDRTRSQKSVSEPLTRVASAESRLDHVVRSPVVPITAVPVPVPTPTRKLPPGIPESMLPPGITPPALIAPPTNSEPVAGDPASVASDEADPDFQTDIEEIEKAIAPEVVPSTFGATGHLSVAAMEPLERKQAARPVREGKEEEAGGRSTKKKRRRGSRSDKRVKAKEDEPSVAPARPAHTRPVPVAALPPSPNDPADPAALPAGPIEDVVLQTPLETNTVHRIENVIGATRAAGWPVILIRSDLPDDLWWVQQMVGAGGNSFSGRVNFGNEHSVGGSVYHMVIVFLDSPDEMRRFRIAKQFKELPEGIRRSRRFTYVRR